MEKSYWEIEKEKERKRTRRIINMSIGGGLGLIILLLAIFNIYTVKTGEVAIVSSFGKVVKVQEPGLHIKIPFVQKKHIMTTKERAVKFGNPENGDDFPTIEASSKDLQTIQVQIAVSNVITNPLKLYEQFTGNHLNSLMNPRIRDAVQSQVAKYTIEEFVEQRDNLAKDIFEDIEQSFITYGIQLTNVSIVDHDFDDEYDNAVRKKKVAQQAVETEKANQQKLIIEAESKIKLKELQIKEKEKEAEANKIESQTLTPELLQKLFIEKWNGELPISHGGNGSILIPSDYLEKVINNPQ